MRGLIYRFGTGVFLAAMTVVIVALSMAITVAVMWLRGDDYWNSGLALAAGVPLFLVPLTWYGFIKVLEKLERTEHELREALEQVQVLSGLLPICASCKMIRDGEGKWAKVEAYISAHTEVEFSHGICPECAKKLYPTYFQ